MCLLRPLPKRCYAHTRCHRPTAALGPQSIRQNALSSRHFVIAKSGRSVTLGLTPGSHTLRGQNSHAYSTTTPSRERFRIAVIGSGPAGFYTAHRLLKQVENVVVDMYEQLPVPYGLVRFGVAPDHPGVKKCQDTFEADAQSPRFNYIGNVRVGHDIQLLEMKPHYDAMLFSYGASEDKKLNIPGEDSQGVHSAREFVGWYNGLPQFQHLNPKLHRGEQAIVIGQGNVALDVARILLTPVDMLRYTDMAEQALQDLSESKVKFVRVVGRRGPLQASFTVKELRELMHIDTVTFEPIYADEYPRNTKDLPRVQRRISEVLLKGTKGSRRKPGRAWALDFFKAPREITSIADHLSAITFQHQRFCRDSDPLEQTARVEAKDRSSTLEASHIFRSVGYKSAALPGLSDLGVPFDERLGIIPNDVYGRVLSPSLGPGDLTAGHVPGLYCAGWVKRGPTGIIASTMQDAFTSAEVIAQDWSAGVPFLNHSDKGDNQSTSQGWDAIKEEVMKKGVRPLSWKDWRAIDEAEKERGKNRGKPREKFTSVKEMLEVLDA